ARPAAQNTRTGDREYRLQDVAAGRARMRRRCRLSHPARALVHDERREELAGLRGIQRLMSAFDLEGQCFFLYEENARLYLAIASLETDLAARRPIEGHGVLADQIRVIVIQ